MNRSKSHELYARAKQLMPGGVNSAARAFGGVGGEPVVFEKASGAYLFDVDGNRYIDYIGSWGPMILGHQHPAVVAAVHAAADKAFSFGAPRHGGIALGLDRFVMLAAAADSIRDVIAFPKNNRGTDLMTHSPVEVDFKQLRELYIQSTAKKA